MTSLGSVRKLRHLFQLFHKWKTATSVQKSLCREFSGPFRGSIKRVTSSWKPNDNMLEHQNSLPHQPVPPLKQTMKRFLDSVRAVLDDDQYCRAVELTEDFSQSGGEGERLQTLLEERAEEEENWLADWWINVAYLGYRDPVVPLTNPGFVADYLDNFEGKEGQLRCAAIAIASVLDYKLKVDHQSLPIEKIAGTPQCMIQYYHILGSCRVPSAGIDHVITNHPHDPTAPRHVAVLHNNHIFHVDVYDKSNRPLSTEQIYKQLEKVVEMSDTKAAPLGILTAAHRDAWQQAYDDLCKDPQNARNFKSIQQSIMCVCLDQPLPGYSRDSHYDSMSFHNLAGGGSTLNSGNRWNDKQFQVFVNVDGVYGFSYEHSVAEGPPVMDIITHIQSCLKRLKALHQENALEAYNIPTELQFNFDSKALDAMQAAGIWLDKTMSEISNKTLVFKHYGRSVMKEMKIPPDGFIQANIQLAYYRMYGHLVSTYESGTLRKFRLGRTETIRSASIPALNYCQAMDDPGASPAERISLLQKAASHHRWYTDQASQGQAIDRHLLGLKLTAMEHQIDMPKFLNDPIYTNSVRWTLSSTTVTMIQGGVVIFAPVVHDGYGIYYNSLKDKLVFGLSAWNTCSTNDVYKFSHYLEQALLDAYKNYLQISKV